MYLCDCVVFDYISSHMPKILEGQGLVLDASAWHTVGPLGMKTEESQVPGTLWSSWAT